MFRTFIQFRVATVGSDMRICTWLELQQYFLEKLTYRASSTVFENFTVGNKVISVTE